MASAVESYLRWAPSRKLVLWIAIGAVLGGAYYALPYRSAKSTIDSIGKQYADLDKDLREKQAVAANLPVVKEAVKQLDIHLEKVLEKLPGSEEIPALLKTVSDLGIESGLDSILFKPDKAKPVGPKYFYAEVPFSMEYAGSYHDLGTFFDKISRLPRIVSIDNVDIDTETYDPKNEAILEMKIKARTFRFLPPEERPKPDKKKKK